MNKTVIYTFAALLAIGTLYFHPLQAQGGFTITSSFASPLRAGPDYATDVLNDPWDMSNAEDLSIDPSDLFHWGSDFAVNGSAHPGQAGGTTTDNQASIGLLYSGFYGVVNPVGPAHNGRYLPIDTSKYKKFSVKLSTSVAGQQVRVSWFHCPWVDPACGSGVTGRNDGSRFLDDQTASGFKIWAKDLSERVDAGTAWTSGVVRALSILPSSAGSSQPVFIDWVRLTPADNDTAKGAVSTTVTWTGGTATVDVVDSAGAVLPLGTRSSPYTFWYGALPPGAYTFRVCSSSSSSCSSSSASKAFTINNPPLVQITDPSMTSGEDYATTVFGSGGWDMSQQQDVQPTSINFTPMNPFDLTSTPGTLTGTNPNGNGDPAVALLADLNNATPIDTNKYRFATYRLSVDGTFDVGLGSVARLFWGAGPGFDEARATTTKDIFVWPGMNSYTIDLSTLTSAPDGGLLTSGSAETWTSSNKRFFRLDPHEFDTSRTFHLDEVRLRATPASTGSYVIRWTGSDADDPAATVNVYYDADQNPLSKTLIASGVALSAGQVTWNTSGVPPNNYWIYIEATDSVNTTARYSEVQVIVAGVPAFTLQPANTNVAAGQNAVFSVGATGSPSVQWQQSLNGGLTWANLSDSGGYTGTNSGILTIFGPAPSLNKSQYRAVVSNSAGSATSNAATLTVRTVVANVDGDAKADLVVFRPAGATWFALKSTDSSTSAVQWGLSTDVPVPADYDGDGKMDLAVYRPSSGTWFIVQSSTANTTAVALTFGVVTDVPAPADYDGDGKADLAVFRPSTGTWIIAKSSANYSVFSTISLGIGTDIPVPGDYDGDGKADAAIYRPSTGTWSVRKSSTGSTTALVLQWGLAGDIPVPGDYDGDGNFDVAVFRPSNGVWFLRFSSTGFATSSTVQWGLSSDIPVPLDFDGDGRLEIAVYRPGNGFWYILASSTNWTVPLQYQFGLGGDVPVPNSQVANGLASAPFRPTSTPLADLARASDFDGDIRSEITVYRPGNGTWYTRLSTSGYGASAAYQWGLNGDVPVPADYDGDGRSDFAVWRPSTGIWYLLQSSTGFGTSLAVQWGLNGDVPVPGDYDGDGRADLAVWRPGNGNWYILQSSTNYTAAVTYQWGLSSDTTVPGDYDGDGVSDLAVYRPSTATWYVRTSSTAFAGSLAVQWGLNGDTATPGDYDGDGKTDFAVWRPSSGTWFVRSAGSGAITSRQFGLAGDTPVAGDYDGDGKTDFAVWRPGNGTWYLATSSTGYSQSLYQWGLNGDIPILHRP